MNTPQESTKPRIEKLTRTHNLSIFDCGVEALNVFLRQYATQNQKKGGSQTWVAVLEDRVVGYYTLTVGEVAHHLSPEALRKGLSRHPVPVMILARLAVDQAFHGQKLGQGMLLDALRRTLQAADIAGIRAMLVHAKDDTAQAFYTHFGFEPFPETPLTLYRLLKDVRG